MKTLLAALQVLTCMRFSREGQNVDFMASSLEIFVLGLYPDRTPRYPATEKGMELAVLDTYLAGVTELRPILQTVTINCTARYLAEHPSYQKLLNDTHIAVSKAANRCMFTQVEMPMPPHYLYELHLFDVEGKEMSYTILNSSDGITLYPKES